LFAVSREDDPQRTPEPMRSKEQEGNGNNHASEQVITIHEAIGVSVHVVSRVHVAGTLSGTDKPVKLFFMFFSC
jgi:hypothetical protein